MTKPSPVRDAGIKRIEEVFQPGFYYTVLEASVATGIKKDYVRDYLERMESDGTAGYRTRKVGAFKMIEYCLIGEDMEVEIKRKPTVVWVHRDWSVAAIHGPAKIGAAAE
ncbi:hypothetical protein ACFQAT_08045 [Undibacterium arcticum]|uniref:DNA-binding protein n=1 Tax=Undibacterium arcticum TaxID=1762892 RepID=A0ABV7EZS8_9BURK